MINRGFSANEFSGALVMVGVLSAQNEENSVILQLFEGDYFTSGVSWFEYNQPPFLTFGFCCGRR